MYKFTDYTLYIFIFTFKNSIKYKMGTVNCKKKYIYAVKKNTKLTDRSSIGLKVQTIFNKIIAGFFLF